MLTRGDRAPHTTYSTAYYPSLERRTFELGRGWVGRGGKTVIPAPAVTYAGRATLPLLVTLALVPLAGDDPTGLVPPISAEGGPHDRVWHRTTAARCAGTPRRRVARSRPEPRQRRCPVSG